MKLFIFMEKIKIRHPEKINKPFNPIKKKPNWIRTKIFDTKNILKLKKLSINKNLIQFAKKLTVLTYLNVGVKNMLHL